MKREVKRIKTNNYQKVIDDIINELHPLDGRTLGVIKKITVKEIEEIDCIIKNRKPIVQFFQNHNDILTKITYGRILKEIFLKLYSEKELEDYFFDMIVNLEKNEETWIEPNYSDLFFAITGLTNVRKIDSQGRAMFLSSIFINTFENRIVNTHFYPDSFKLKVIEKIEKNQSLKDECLEFKTKYKNSVHLLLTGYMNDYILPIIGEEKFCQYIHFMVEEYISTLKEVNLQTVKQVNFLDYIFGSEIYMPNKIRESKNNKKLYIYYLMQKEFFPYMMYAYNRQFRKSAYSFFEYTEEEIEICEKKIMNYNRIRRDSGYAAALLEEKIVECRGIKIEKIYECIDIYMEYLLKTERIIPNYHSFLLEVSNFFKDDRQLYLVFKNMTYNQNCNIVVHRYFNKKYNEALIYLFKNNKKELKQDKDNFILYFIKEDGYSRRNIDLSNILDKEIKKYLIDFISYIEKKQDFVLLGLVTSSVIPFFEFISKYEINDLADIEEWHILSYLNHLDLNLKLKPGTLNKKLLGIKKFFDYAVKNIDKTIEDPTFNIVVSHIDDHKVPTHIIPKDILLFLNDNIQNIKQKDIPIVYKILSITGWRLGDIKRIKVDDILKESLDSNFATIRVSTNKTKKARIKASLGDIIEDNIPIELYNEIMKYIEDTKHIREMYDIDTLFFSIFRNRKMLISGKYINHSINNFLKENKIVSIDETYYDFTTRQTRRTVASELISAGAPVAFVQKKLGHTQPQTTEQFYAYVNEKRISELNHEFFKEKFDIYMDEEKLKLFTEEERRILYVDFALGNRNTELGVCSKHPSEGKCSYLNGKSCAGCPKLCTGKAYLEQWEKLMNDSYNLLIQFENKYKELNIPEEEYQDFIEYKQEKRLYKQYKSVIEAINGGK